LLSRFFGSKILAVSEQLYKKPWGNLGFGFLALIAFPIAIFFLFVVLVGYYVALIGLMVYILCILLASLLAAMFVGAWLVKMLTKRPDLVIDWQAVVIGVVVLRLITIIPVVGWIACAILFLMSFGALLRTLRYDGGAVQILS
jgi:hypothetical protein